MSGIADRWSRQKRLVFEKQFYNFLGCYYINSKDTGSKTCLGEHIFNAQRLLFNSIFDGLEQGIHDFKVLKSRQLGISAASRALTTFWLGVHDGLPGAMVFDSDENKNAARREIEAVIDNLPKSLKFPEIKVRNRQGVILGNQATLHFRSAGVSPTRSSGTLGASLGLSFVHACMAPGTPVVVQDGRVLPIESVRPGDRVITHDGHAATVIANEGKENDRGPMIRITPWLGMPVVCTADHKIATHRGLVDAGDLRPRDLLVMPIRKITRQIEHIDLPLTPPRPQGGGSIAIGSGSRIELGEEFGFAIGYYLAEGTLRFSGREDGRTQTPSGIQFTRHRTEVGYAQRACAALAPYASHARTEDKEECLTSCEHLYGAPLARWIGHTFGWADDKIIPDEVFGYGEEFCRGLLAGLLSGDGSKNICRAQKYEINGVNLVTTRSSIALQARDLAVSLGYGWASLRIRNEGIWYNRNCKQLWILDWNGEAGRLLRALIGLPVVISKSQHISKYRIASEHILIQIRKIETGLEQPVMFDLSVDHDDHTFRTPWFSVSNSEMCAWANEKGVEAFLHSLSEVNPDRLYLWESTARGRNLWHTMWSAAKEDSAHQGCIFIGWWAKESQRIERTDPDFMRYGEQLPTDAELAKINEVRERYGHHITAEQLAWYRRRMDPAAKAEGDLPVEYEGDITRIQEQATTEDDAFIMTGATFFDPMALTNQAERYVSNKYESFTYQPGLEFHETRIYKAPNPKSTQLKVWEQPTDNAVYILGCDPAYGTSESNDRASCQVLRAYADGLDQVAEFASPVFNSQQFAWVVASLMGHYGSFPDSEVYHIVELNGAGEAVWIELQSLKRYVQQGYLARPSEEKGIHNIFMNVRNYIYTRSDAMSAGRSWQWQTNQRRKVTIMELLRALVSTGALHVRSQALLDEMESIEREGDTIEAMGSRKDDRVIAMALAVKYWEQTVRRILVSLNRTRANEEAKRRLSMTDMLSMFHSQQLQNFFAAKQAVRSKEAALLRRQAWRHGRR